MTHTTEAGVCDADGCAIDSAPAERAGTVPAPAKRLAVEIVSDAICPWCFVAKRQFERAVARLPADVALSVAWRPYELNPDMPIEGMDRVTYRSRKFGSWEHSQRLDAQVSAAAAQAGIEMRHDLMERTPNTFNAHRLVWLAEREGVQDAVVEALFRAYFVEGRDVGHRSTLIEIATAAGIASERAEAFFSGTEGFDDVRAAETAAHRQGLNGVPTFILNGRPAFSGAQRAEVMLAHMLDAVGAS
jgi:predicted DsbA family dithiol-disulfide isomerase